MNRALIFAGGKGERMKINGSTPKQFLEIKGKPIIIHTLEKFENNNNINDIVVVCIESWIPVLEEMIKSFKLRKISKILPGGATGFDSRMIGLQYLYDTKSSDDDIVLLHDGVRPFINNKLIDDNIRVATLHGNAITTAKATETIMYSKGELQIIDREFCTLARAPQTFKLNRIYDLYLRSIKDDKTEIIDSASLAFYYGDKLNLVDGLAENIKVTTAIDFYAATGIIDSENFQD
ncbi:MAG: 2-C-methyl-D-erythritol 4-phosphate cytidylyltransferase [Clostridiales bacterium]|nr:2-C-methyl-D-erythritol 4-phosphate cytidylyltransferase [Clostridiales bacterium]